MIRNTVNIRKNQDCECGNQKTRLEGDRKEEERQRSDREKGISRKKCQIQHVELEYFHILSSKLMMVIVERHTNPVFVSFLLCQV